LLFLKILLYYLVLYHTVSTKLQWLTFCFCPISAAASAEEDPDINCDEPIWAEVAVAIAKLKQEI